MEEAQILSQKCLQYEDDLDLAQKQYANRSFIINLNRLKDLKKDYRVKFDLVETLQVTNNF